MKFHVFYEEISFQNIFLIRFFIPLFTLRSEDNILKKLEMEMKNCKVNLYISKKIICLFWLLGNAQTFIFCLENNTRLQNIFWIVDLLSILWKYLHRYFFYFIDFFVIHYTRSFQPMCQGTTTLCLDMISGI